MYIYIYIYIYMFLAFLGKRKPAVIRKTKTGIHAAGKREGERKRVKVKRTRSQYNRVYILGEHNEIRL